jgi:hypothetical protein
MSEEDEINAMLADLAREAERALALSDWIKI